MSDENGDSRIAAELRRLRLAIQTIFTVFAVLGGLVVIEMRGCCFLAMSFFLAAAFFLGVMVLPRIKRVAREMVAEARKQESGN